MANKTEEIEKTEIDLEAIEEIAAESLESDESDALVPQLNVGVPMPAAPEPEQPDLVSGERLIGRFDEVLDNIRKDRDEIDNLLAKFADMALNDGDATTSTKEAVVNLMKMKLDTADKYYKIAELETRIKLRERDTFPKYLAVNQNNTFNTTKARISPDEKRRLIAEEAKKGS